MGLFMYVDDIVLVVDSGGTANYVGGGSSICDEVVEDEVQQYEEQDYGSWEEGKWNKLEN